MDRERVCVCFIWSQKGYTDTEIVTCSWHVTIILRIILTGIYEASWITWWIIIRIDLWFIMQTGMSPLLACIKKKYTKKKYFSLINDHEKFKMAIPEKKEEEEEKKIIVGCAETFFFVYWHEACRECQPY